MSPAIRHVPRRAFLGGMSAVLVLGGGPACSTSSPTPRPVPELNRLRVSYFPVPDTGPLLLAHDEGLFERAGLDVELVDITQAIAENRDPGPIDIFFGSFVGFLFGISQGEDLVIITDGSQARTGCTGILVTPTSSYSDLAERPRPRIAVDAVRGVGALLVLDMLAGHGIDPAAVRFVEIPFVDMGAALDRGEIDGAWLVEPYITRLQLRQGSILLADCDSGASKSFPLGGYACLRSFAESHPKTVEVFSDVVLAAQIRANADRTVVERVLIEHFKLDRMTAQLMALPVFPTTLERTRIQRVADTMLRYQRIEKPIDVAGKLLSGRT
jgi:NitT/TauT family transport system substrate-binding protein